MADAPKSFPKPGDRSPSLLGFGALLVFVTLIAYQPALRGGFIFDDNVFLTENPLIHAADGLQRFWFSREAADYWPVTSTTLWLEWRLWGLNAAGYHVTNVALHIATVLLLWAVLHRLDVPGAWLGALFFALHPMNAESVTWITERKNLMALLFFLLSILWFTGGKRRDYWLSLSALVLAMLSKGSTVILPLVLLGIGAWQRRPLARAAARLAPFFIVAAGLALFEATFSTIVAAEKMQATGVLERVLRAGGVIWFYLGKAIWPRALSFDYGPWAIRTDALRWWLPLIAACALTAVLWRARRTWSRPALFAWGYFCVALLPVLGFAEVGFMRYSPVSDHFAHLAIVGVAAAGGAGGWWLARRTGKFQRTFLVVTATALIAVGGTLTWQQSGNYADAVTLYRETIARNPTSWVALNNLGALLSDAGQNDQAIALLEAAVRVQPALPESRNNLGLALYRLGRLDEARLHYEEAVRTRPDFFKARNNLGVVLAQRDRLPEAIRQFEEALRLAPSFGEAQENLARALLLQQRETLPSR
ncbi:MAG TPA: tetratricopeptide repeat protein [Opitutaceae bacterium]|nr:tetratricopeptide repeat protein [Opitutaceae bacterium]